MRSGGIVGTSGVWNAMPGMSIWAKGGADRPASTKSPFPPVNPGTEGTGPKPKIDTPSFDLPGKVFENPGKQGPSQGGRTWSPVNHRIFSPAVVKAAEVVVATVLVVAGGWALLAGGAAIAGGTAAAVGAAAFIFGPTNQGGGSI